MRKETVFESSRGQFIFLETKKKDGRLDVWTLTYLALREVFSHACV